ncbi:MAG: tyrosine-type recombinase/integrase [Blastocatellia bacterium]
MTETPDNKKPKPRRTGQVIDRSAKNENGKSRGDRWLIRIFICKDASGKRHWHNETFHGKRKQAEARARDLLQKVKTGEPLKADNSQFNAFIDEWLRAHPDLKESTVVHYQCMMDLYVRPKLGGAMLARISADNVQTLYDDLRAEGLGGTTISHVHTLLRSVFKLAILRKRIRENPMDGVKSPRGKRLTQEQRRRREAKVMTPEQARAFLVSAEQTRFGVLFALAFHAGCRPGELLAVTWDDLDATARSLKIWRNIKWPSAGKWYFDDPKSESSRRDLRLDAGVFELLAAHKKRQLEERMKAGKAWRAHNFVFCDEIGEPYSQARLWYYCKKILREAGLPETFSPYSTRYSSATWMADQNVSATTIAGRLGHADVATTLQYYVHSTEGMDEQAVEKLTRALEGKK